MDNAELIKVYMLLQNASDEQLKEELRSTGRIEEKNLDLAWRRLT